MSISPLNSAASNPYATSASKTAAAKLPQAVESDSDKGLNVKPTATKEADSDAPALEDNVKSFAYGFLGFDKPSEVEEEVVEEVEVKTEAEEKTDDAYFAGKVAKGIGTLGTIIAILV
ncbi:hypothetical protein OFY17_06590 [Marinomonas sp. C2222]|uniref:Uncharacterized protein n=1 Tax=Marinomonas sargassi TaxID=2984494 RepID=A0ABT2YRN9_9GAMM|nr:hypothetical protein [Marinomonas sargassi]MCV2402559.1 hypothetical protein [Marinomonas sargassi]